MKTKHAIAVVALGAAAGGAALAGCAGGAEVASSGSTANSVCEPGSVQACACTVVSGSTQVCDPDGKSWGACACGNDGGGGSGTMEAGAPMCGDGVCNGTESCTTCPADCGQCPACTLAPSCTGASSVPANATALPSFNNAGQTSYTSGTGFDDPNSSEICSYPLLKMRVQDLVVHKNGSPSSLEVFCMVQADDGQSSQLILTSDYMSVSDNNPPLVMSPAQGTFWGQAVNGVKLSQFNINITYTCYMVTQEGALQKALGAIAGFGAAAAAIPGDPYGWAFGTAGAAAAAIAAATATAQSAVPLLNVSQTIDQDALLKLTNGYTWSIEQSGSTKADGDCDLFESCDWDWQLDIEAWGCAAPKGQMPQ